MRDNTHDTQKTLIMTGQSQHFHVQYCQHPLVTFILQCPCYTLIELTIVINKYMQTLILCANKWNN